MIRLVIQGQDIVGTLIGNIDIILFGLFDSRSGGITITNKKNGPAGEISAGSKIGENAALKIP